MRFNMIITAFMAVLLQTAITKASANTRVDTMLANLPSTISLTFYEPEHFTQIRLIHDTVMGGRSTGNIAVIDEPPGLLFVGNLSLANNGGFASAEFTLAKPLRDKVLNSLYLHALADGRKYQLRLKTPFIPNGVAYVAEFETDTMPQHYYVPLAAFRGQYRGQAIRNMPKLNLADVSQISIMLADKQDGAFSITLYSITFSAVNTI
ncbi:CIA30 family protein [Alishewanella longhuensis]|nr:CIA30 family protein [Alishewanella longhuensis]